MHPIDRSTICRQIGVIAAATLCGPLAVSAHAQEYPVKPVRMIVGFAPGEIGRAHV